MSGTKPAVLIVGVGSIGARHVECFQKTGDVCVSICEIDDARRENVRDQFSIERSYADLQTALADPHDAVVVATPANKHILVAQQAAEAGMHLLIEKPLSVTTRGVQQLVEAIEQQRLVAAVAYVYRAHPGLAAMKKALDAGRFGKPLQLVAVAGQDFQVSSGISQHLLSRSCYGRRGYSRCTDTPAQRGRVARRPHRQAGC